MKYVLGVCACLVIVVASVAAQQEPPPKQTPSIQPTAEALLKAQAAAEKAQAKREEPSTEALKKLVEREIAKSAGLPVTTIEQTELLPITVSEPSPEQKPESKIVVIDGTIYVRMGITILPMAGSGCFLTQEESDARTKRAQAKFAEMNKAEPVKKD